MASAKPTAAEPWAPHPANPSEALAQEAAVVTWHVDRGAHLGRRTAVLRVLDGSWKIVSYHASNVDPSSPGSDEEER